MDQEISHGDNVSQFNKIPDRIFQALCCFYISYFQKLPGFNDLTQLA